jgi:hypothetical protein
MHDSVQQSSGSRMVITLAAAEPRLAAAEIR